MADVVLGESKKFTAIGQDVHSPVAVAVKPYLVTDLTIVLPRNILTWISLALAITIQPALKVTSTLLEVDEGVIVTVAPVMSAKPLPH